MSCLWSDRERDRWWKEFIFGNYLKLFIDELFGWPSTALKQTKMKENQKLINEQNTESNSERGDRLVWWCGSFFHLILFQGTHPS